MKYCGNCGAPASSGAFCGNCGATLGAPQTQSDATVQRERGPASQPAPYTKPMPVETPSSPATGSGWGAASPAPEPPAGPRPGTGAYGGPQLPPIDWRKLAVGNWLGAGITAGATLGSAGLAALVLGLLAKPDNFGLHNTLTLVAGLLGSVFGADFVVSAEVDKNELHANLGVFPLTLSLLVAAVAILVFRRVTARYPEPTVALGDAARTGLLVGVPLMLVAIIFRSNTDKVGEGWAAMLMDMLNAKIKFGSSIFGGLVLGFLTVFFVLAVSLFLRRDWWGPRVQKAHEWLAAPLYGAGTTLALLPAAGLVGVLLLFVGGESNTSTFDNSDDTMATLAFGFAALANAGMWLISLGSGAALGAKASATGGGGGFGGGGGGGGGFDEMRHLSFYAGDEPGLWAAPLVALAVLFASAYIVARRSPEPSYIVGNMLRWVGLQFLAIPFFVRLANVHVGFSEKSGNDSMGMHGFAGPSGVQATFFLTFLALLCAVGVAALFRAIDVERLKDQFSTVAAQLQSTPGQPAPQSGPQQSGPQQSGPQQPASQQPGGWGQPAAQPAAWGQPAEPPTTGHPTAPQPWGQPSGQPGGPSSQVPEERTQVRPDRDWTRPQEGGPWGPPPSGS